VATLALVAPATPISLNQNENVYNLITQATDKTTFNRNIYTIIQRTFAAFCWQFISNPNMKKNFSKV